MTAIASSNRGRRRCTLPRVRTAGAELVEVTATIGGGLSDVPRGSPTGTGYQVVADYVC